MHHVWQRKLGWIHLGLDNGTNISIAAIASTVSTTTTTTTASFVTCAIASTVRAGVLCVLCVLCVGVWVRAVLAARWCIPMAHPFSVDAS
jgi:hypothetical protein